MGQDGCGGEGRLQSFKGLLGSIREIPRSTLVGQPGQWYNDARVIGNKSLVEIREA